VTIPITRKTSGGKHRDNFITTTNTIESLALTSAAFPRTRGIDVMSSAA
jgi:hypothetical protein